MNRIRDAMTIRLHQGDLPSGDRALAHCRDRHRNTGPQPASRPAVPRRSFPSATATPSSCRSPAARRARPISNSLLADPTVLKLFHFARFDIGDIGQDLRLHSGAGLLHQDRLQARPHLYGPAWPEGSRARACLASRSRSSSSLRTGARRTLTDAQQAYAASDVLYLHQLKEKLDAMLAREGRDRSGAGLFRLPAGARAARSRRLAGDGYFLPMSKAGERGFGFASNSPPAAPHDHAHDRRLAGRPASPGRRRSAVATAPCWSRPPRASPRRRAPFRRRCATRRESRDCAAGSFGARAASLGIVGLGLLISSLRFLPVDLSLARVALKGTRIVIESPKLVGYRKDGRPYEVRARVGTQDWRSLTSSNSIRARRAGRDQPGDNAISPVGGEGRLQQESRSGRYERRRRHPRRQELRHAAWSPRSWISRRA